MVALWQVLCQGLIVSEDKLLGVLWQLPYWNVGCQVQWTLQEQGWNRWNVSFRSLIQVIGQFWQVHLIEIILFISWPIQNVVITHTRKRYLLILSNTVVHKCVSTIVKTMMEIQRHSVSDFCICQTPWKSC